MRAVVWLLTFTAGCSAVKAPPPPADGKRLFAAVCARCHGEDGRGGVPLDAGIAPRNFRDAAFQRDRTDEQIMKAIVDGKNDAMPGFGQTFNPSQLRALVAYIRTLDPRGR